MARVQYSFTFTNAQQGAQVHLSTPGLGLVDVYATADEGLPNDDDLILDAENAVSVWADVDTLTARTVDGRGKVLELTATRAAPTQTSSDGFAGTFANGGSVPVGVGDYARWDHSGAAALSYEPMDWVADIESQDGDSIAVDSSSDWVTDVAGWGAPVPVVAVAGVYTISATVTVGGTPTGRTTVKLTLMGADANDVPAYSGTLVGEGLVTATATATVYVPAGTHLSVGLTLGGGGSLSRLKAMIQKVG